MWRWRFAAISLMVLPLAPGASAAAEAPPRPDANSAMTYLDNAALLAKAADELPADKEIRFRVIRIALQGNDLEAMKAAAERARAERQGSFIEIMRVAAAYRGLDAALAVIDMVGTAGGEDSEVDQVDMLFLTLGDRPRDKAAGDRIVARAVAVSRKAQARVAARPGADLKTWALTPGRVVERFANFYLERKEFDRAREIAVMNDDPAGQKKLLDYITAVQNQPPRKRKPPTTAAKPAAPAKPAPAGMPDAGDLDSVTHYVLDNLPAEQAGLKGRIEPPVRQGDWAKANQVIESVADVRQRIPLYVLCTAAHLKAGDKARAADSFVSALECESLENKDEHGDVTELALHWMPLIEATGDAAFIARMYVTAAQLSTRAANEETYARSDVFGLAARQARVGSLQDAVDWVLSLPHNSEFGQREERSVLKDLSDRLWIDVVAGRVTGPQSKLRLTAVPLATFLDGRSFLGKPVETWAQQLGSPTPDGTPTRSQKDACTALAVIGKAGIPALIEHQKKYAPIKTREPRERGIAAEALCRVGDDAIPSLVRLLAEQRNGNYLSTVTALWYLGPQATLAVTALLSDPNADVRLVACKSLGELERYGEQSEPALKKAAQDPDPRVRSAAAEALKAVAKWKSTHAG